MGMRVRVSPLAPNKENETRKQTMPLITIVKVHPLDWAKIARPGSEILQKLLANNYGLEWRSVDRRELETLSKYFRANMPDHVVVEKLSVSEIDNLRNMVRLTTSVKKPPAVSPVKKPIVRKPRPKTYPFPERIVVSQDTSPEPKQTLFSKLPPKPRSCSTFRPGVDIRPVFEEDEEDSEPLN